jgi:hypothetical protein
MEIWSRRLLQNAMKDHMYGGNGMKEGTFEKPHLNYCLLYVSGKHSILDGACSICCSGSER